MLRGDAFKAKKCIHIQLSKEVHTGLRTKLFERGLSMQEVVDELSRLIALDDRRLVKVLDEYVQRKMLKELARLAEGRRKRTIEKIDEMDQDSVYDLINHGEE